jgi:uncharacterized BrkB/YihY/UPF0761 family membrane protein
MGVWGALIAGATCGVAGAAPQAFLFEQALKGQQEMNMALGLLSVLVSFVSLTLILLIVWLVAPKYELTFGIAMVSAYLGVWLVNAGRAWYAANTGSADERRGA